MTCRNPVQNSVVPCIGEDDYVKDLRQLLASPRNQYIITIAVGIDLLDPISVLRIGNLVVGIPLDNCLCDFFEAFALKVARHSRSSFEEPAAVWAWDVAFVMHRRVYVLCDTVANQRRTIKMKTIHLQSPTLSGF
jgi:hypothetical protein